MATVQNYKDLAGNDLFTLDDAGNITIKNNLTVQGNTATTGNTTSGTFNGIVAPLQARLGLIQVSSAQLLALRATPVSLLVAPGAGKYLKILGIDMHYTFVTGAYTNTNAALKVFYGPVASAKAITADQTALLLNTVNAHTLGIANTVQASLTDAQALNVAINLGNDGSAEFLVGAGTLEVAIAYAIVTP